MVFSREKEKLWRYASEKWITFEQISDQQVQQLIHLHPTPPHCYLNGNSISPLDQNQRWFSSCSIQLPVENDCNIYPTLCQEQCNVPREMNATLVTLKNKTIESGHAHQENINKYGYYSGNYDDVMNDGEGESSNCSISTNLNKNNKYSKYKMKTPTTAKTQSVAEKSFQRLRTSISKSRMLRCCGMFGNPNAASINNNYYNSNNNINCNNNNKRIINASNELEIYTEQDRRIHFDALWKILSPDQISVLLKAVKSRREKPSPKSGENSEINSATYQTNCLLLSRKLICNQQPHLMVCRLFFWRKLQSSNQLKRFIKCSNEYDAVYVCCNPLHWFRILEPDTGPPPYRYTVTERSIVEGCTLGENSRNEENTTQAIISNTDDNILYDNKCLEFNKINKANSVWCKIAYWEMKKRVGKLYEAKTPFLHVYAEGEINISENFCIKSNTDPQTSKVQSVRQCIGLGLTLSRETDGVWLYNRSTVSIFIYSPTICDVFCVCRVEPGDCLKAFDNLKAQSVNPLQFHGAHPGPVDKYSMRISFVKGWGRGYRRQDITDCPCWLEVHFTKR